MTKAVESHLDFEEGYYTVQSGNEVVPDASLAGLIPLAGKFHPAPTCGDGACGCAKWSMPGFVVHGWLTVVFAHGSCAVASP